MNTGVGAHEVQNPPRGGLGVLDVASKGRIGEKEQGTLLRLVSCIAIHDPVSRMTNVAD